jgi:hypothetical protein
MNILDFTVEETSLIAIYAEDGGTRAEVTARIAAVLPDMDADFIPIAESSTRKLRAMSDSEFAATSFAPADDTDGDE